MWGNIFWLSFLGCVGMAVQDSVGTFLVRAINTNRPALAGMMDVVGDVATVVFLSICANDLTHGYGWKGYTGILPVLVTAYFVTHRATVVASRMEHPAEQAEDDERDARISELERRLNGMERASGRV